MCSMLAVKNFLLVSALSAQLAGDFEFWFGNDPEAISDNHAEFL